MNITIKHKESKAERVYGNVRHIEPLCENDTDCCEVFLANGNSFTVNMDEWEIIQN